jgi:hypothetical protein
MDGADYCARNWSLGGFLLDAAPNVRVGSLLQGQLHIGARKQGVGFTALTLRRDEPEGTLACRFVNPSAALFDALDGAMAARFRSRGAGLLGAMLAASLLLTQPHQAAAAASSASTGPGGALVPGGFALPEFRLNFPDLLAGPPSGDLQISLTSSDKSVLQFLFSPRSQFGFNTDPGTGTSRGYVGLSWNLFENSGFFGNLGFAGSLTRPGAEEMYRRSLGAPLAVHGTFELGYQINDQHSLTLSLDHATAPDLFSEHGDYNNFRLRYGLKF